MHCGRRGNSSAGAVQGAIWAFSFNSRPRSIVDVHQVSKAETANQFHNSTKDLKSFQHLYAESDVERSRYRRETCRNIDSCLGGRGPNAVNLFCIPSFAKIWPKPNFGRSFARQEKKSRARERLGSRNRSSSHNSSAQRVEPPEKYATRQSCRYRSASQARAAR